ncbi:MAG: hypothetical protein ACW9XH_02735 [Candidatus Nitrosopumilus sp. bin_32a]
MNKAIVVGIIIGIVIIIGIAFSIPNEMKNDELSSENEIELEENIGSEDNLIEVPSGRNLTIELSESIGIKTP